MGAQEVPQATAETEANKLGQRVTHALVRSQVPGAQAAKIGMLYAHAYLVYRQVANSDIVSELSDASKFKSDAQKIYAEGKKFVLTNRLVQSGMTMSSSKELVDKLSIKRGVSAAGVVGAVGDAVEVFAKRHDIPLNQCALSVTKVTVDGVVLFGEGLSFETGVGAVMAAIQLKSTYGDVKGFYAACVSGATRFRLKRALIPRRNLSDFREASGFSEPGLARTERASFVGRVRQPDTGSITNPPSSQGAR